MTFLKLTRIHLISCAAALSAVACASTAETSAENASASLEDGTKAACTRGASLEDEWKNGVPSNLLFEDLKGATGGVTSIPDVVSAQDYTHLHFPMPARAHLAAFSEIKGGADGATTVTVSGFGSGADPASVAARGLFDAMTQTHQVNAGSRVVRSSSLGYYVCTKTTDMLGIRYSCSVSTKGHATADACP
jgi:hypothetical protein